MQHCPHCKIKYKLKLPTLQNQSHSTLTRRKPTHSHLKRPLTCTYTSICVRGSSSTSTVCSREALMTMDSSWERRSCLPRLRRSPVCVQMWVHRGIEVDLVCVSQHQNSQCTAARVLQHCEADRTCLPQYPSSQGCCIGHTD